jgi:hypothetical protein
MVQKKLEASVFKIGTGKAMKNKWLESLKGGTLLRKVCLFSLPCLRSSSSTASREVSGLSGIAMPFSVR